MQGGKPTTGKARKGRRHCEKARPKERITLFSYLHGICVRTRRVDVAGGSMTRKELIYLSIIYGLASVGLVFLLSRIWMLIR